MLEERWTIFNVQRGNFKCFLIKKWITIAYFFSFRWFLIYLITTPAVFLNQTHLVRLGIFHLELGKKTYFLALGMGPNFGPKFWRSRARNALPAHIPVLPETRQFIDKTTHRHGFWRQFIDTIEDNPSTLFEDNSSTHYYLAIIPKLIK